VTRKTAVACLTLTLCTCAGAAALYVTFPWFISDSPAIAWKSNYVRIELPAVEVVEAGKFTELDRAVLVGDAGKTGDVPAITGAEAQVDEAAEAVDEAHSRVELAARGADEGELDGMLAVSFDLAQAEARGGGPLELRKGVRFNGADAGQATIRVGAGSTLSIASDDLRTLLSGAQRVDLVERLTAGAEQPFVGFDEVRQKGVSLRYDAAADQILISG